MMGKTFSFSESLDDWHSSHLPVASKNEMLKEGNGAIGLALPENYSSPRGTVLGFVVMK